MNDEVKVHHEGQSATEWVGGIDLDSAKEIAAKQAYIRKQDELQRIQTTTTGINIMNSNQPTASLNVAAGAPMQQPTVTEQSFNNLRNVDDLVARLELLETRLKSNLLGAESVEAPVDECKQVQPSGLRQVGVTTEVSLNLAHSYMNNIDNLLSEVL